jgi:hypothetical protein
VKSAVLSDKEQHVHLADHLQGRHSQADCLNVVLMCGFSFRYVYFTPTKIVKKDNKSLQKWVKMRKNTKNKYPFSLKKTQNQLLS